MNKLFYILILISFVGCASTPDQPTIINERLMKQKKELEKLGFLQVDYYSKPTLKK